MAYPEQLTPADRRETARMLKEWLESEEGRTAHPLDKIRILTLANYHERKATSEEQATG